MRPCIRVAAAVILMLPRALPAQGDSAQRTAVDTAARPPRTARVTGMVRDDKGRALAHVRVSVIGLGRETRSSDRGRFVFDSLPAAMFTLEAVRIGAMPGRKVVDLVAGESTIADITLGAGITVLETREISEKWATEIERRARVSTSGYFVKPAEIAARGRNAPLAALLYQVPSVNVECFKPTQCNVKMRAHGVAGGNLQPRYCVPSLYVDGTRDKLADFTYLFSGEILAIEVYRELGRPFEFLDDNRCGAIAVWTKPLEPRTKKIQG